MKLAQEKGFNGHQRKGEGQAYDADLQCSSSGLRFLVLTAHGHPGAQHQENGSHENAIACVRKELESESVYGIQNRNLFNQSIIAVAKQSYHI